MTNISFIRYVILCKRRIQHELRPVLETRRSLFSKPTINEGHTAFPIFVRGPAR